MTFELSYEIVGGTQQCVSLTIQLQSLVVVVSNLKGEFLRKNWQHKPAK